MGVVGAINEGTFLRFVKNVRLNLSDQNASSQDDQLHFSRMTAVSLEEYRRYRAEYCTRYHKGLDSIQLKDGRNKLLLNRDDQAGF